MKTRTNPQNRIRISLVVLFLFITSMAFAQDKQEKPLTSKNINKAVSDSLAPGSTHVYTLALKADQFVYGEVNQITVDVVVTIKDPAGKEIRNFDGPGEGPEPFQFESGVEGEYRIEVKPFEDKSGRYTMLLKGLEPIAKDPGKRVDQLMIPFTGTDKPGGSVAVVSKGKVIFSKGYGMANLTHAIPFTAQTLNNIGSTSKQFTAFAIALLAEKGKLNLDDDVRNYIPELKEFSKTITIRHLLSHTSGYREFLNLLAMGGRNLDEGDYIRREEIIRIVQNQPELQNDPGSLWNYNNTGYCLLATIVERVTEKPFPEWMQENVFKPLGMLHTVIRSHPRQIVPNSSQGYMAAAGNYQEGRDLGSSMGAGGIYSTVGDLAKWIGNFRTNKVGSKSIYRQMTTPYILTTGDTTGYGMGLFIAKYRGLRQIHHGGADIAHRSMLAYYPEIDAGVITQSNNSGFKSALAAEIAEAFFGKDMEPEEVEKTETTESGAFNPEDYDPKKFDDFAGLYELDEAAGFILTFTREEGKFYTQATGQAKTEIVPVSDSTFKLLIVEASVTFHRDKNNKVTSLTLNQGGEHPAKRLDEEVWKPSSEELMKYTGRYFSPELETFYTLAVEDSGLVVKHKQMADIKLTPVKKNNFLGLDPIPELIFICNDAGEAVALEVSAGRTKDVRFDRTEINDVVF